MLAREVIEKAPGLAREFVESAIHGYPMRHLFDHVACYCSFIGFSRTGSTMMGAFLNAHPNILIGHESPDLKYILARFSRTQLYYLIHQNLLHFVEHRHVTWSGYSYAVPDQWQGRYEMIHIIGNKNALATSIRLQKRPYLLKRLQQTVGVPIKFIHLYRNPYDCITTDALKNRRGYTLAYKVAAYKDVCTTVEWTREQVGSDAVLDIQFEAFIASPHEYLRRIYAFVGVEASDELVNACASIVRPTPNRTRDQVQWSRELRDQVEQTIARWPYLHRYSFDS